MKRFIDIFATSIGLILLMPILVLLSIIVLIKHGQPILFMQTRAGYNGAEFKLYKFRTMTSECDEQGKLLPDEQRLTAYGRFLRSTSLDELPGLWNVLKGDMSLVGPRPLLMDYLPLYNSQQMLRHTVRPGITGWAQVNGRNTISWAKKFELDVWYVEHQSFWLDVKILLLTVKKVFLREDINSAEAATASRFTGCN